MSTGPTIRRRRKDARPQELTAAALALFVEKGFAATRLDDVARRAGVSKGTLYLYFDGKEALFKAVIQEAVVPVLVEGEAMLAQESDPVSLLRAILLGWWERVGSTALGGVVKLMMAEARNFPDVAAFYQEAVIERGLALIRATVERGIRRGVFRDVALDDIGPLLIAPLVQMTLWRHSFGACCRPAAPTDANGAFSPTANLPWMAGNPSAPSQEAAAREQCYLESYFDLIFNGLMVVRSQSGGST